MTSSPTPQPQPTLSTLPNELLHVIYSHLHLPLLIRLSSTCKHLRALAYEGCDPFLWSELLDFWGAQYVDRVKMNEIGKNGDGGRGAKDGRGVRVNLGKLDDASLLAILDRIPVQARMNVRKVNLDYSEVTRRGVEPLLQLVYMEGGKLEELSFNGCSRLFLEEDEVYRLFRRSVEMDHMLKLGLLGTYLVSKETFAQELFALSDGLFLNSRDPTEPPIELSRFDHAVGSYTHSSLLLPDCSIPNCKTGKLDNGSFVFSLSSNQCSNCKIREHVCGDRWRCKSAGSGRCGKVGCGRRTGCQWCGDVGCAVHDLPRV